MISTTTEIFQNSLGIGFASPLFVFCWMLTVANKIVVQSCFLQSYLDFVDQLELDPGWELYNTHNITCVKEIEIVDANSSLNNIALTTVSSYIALLIVVVHMLQIKYKDHRNIMDKTSLYLIKINDTNSGHPPFFLNIYSTQLCVD